MTLEAFDIQRLDVWYDLIGANIIPMNTQTNIPAIPEVILYRSNRASAEEYKEWKEKGLFDNGAATMLGRVYREQITDKDIPCYLAVIDIETQLGIDEICTLESNDGIVKITLDDIATKFVVEQHSGNPCSAHIFFYTTKPIPHGRLIVDGKCIMEIFSEPNHLMNISPSKHEDTTSWAPKDGGTIIPDYGDKMVETLQRIFKKYGQNYLKGNDKAKQKQTNYDPFAVEEEPLYEGNRNSELYRKCCSLLRKEMGKTPLQEIKIRAFNYNKRKCKPALDVTEFEAIWKSAVNFIGKKARDSGRKKQEQKEDSDALPALESELTEKYKFKSLKDTDDIYYWNNDKGVYVKNAEWLIKQECMVFDPEMKPHNVDEVLKHIIWSNYIDRAELDSQIEWLATKNCMVNLKTLETKEHSPDYLATVQIPHNFNSMLETYEPLIGANGKMLKEAHSVEEWEQLCKCPCPCPEIMKFFYEVIAPEDVETILDFMAYCLWRGLPFHKYLLFNGGGRNGKGVTIHLFKKLLGWRNISSESLKRILETRFASAKLYGKMANIDADISKEELKHTGTLKTLTGEDLVSAEFKFKDPFDFENYAKLVFSANEIPITPDEADAFFARLIIINFPNQYVGDKADPWLRTKLTTEEEMCGLLSLVVARLPTVLVKGIYTLHSSIEENYQKYMLSSNPIRAFYELTIRKETGNNESKQSVFDSYIKFCEDKKLAKESIDTFNRRLKADWGLLDSKIQKDGVRVPHWLDIKRIDYMEAEEGQEQLV